MDERQQRRVAENQARFRAMNEQARRAVDAFEPDTDHYSMMCECALTECDEMIEVSRTEYDEVRSNPGWFLVLPDHYLPGAEAIIDRTDSRWIVELRGAGRDVASDSYTTQDGAPRGTDPTPDDRP
ncbi:MAG: hypothetical protein JWM86_1016 [Thermoleophilia bacterium]|nr:hypothetical protein [Thermoleophilia bacterium]